MSRAPGALRLDFLKLLDELEAALKEAPKAGYPRRGCHITVEDECDAGAESVVAWDIEQAEIDMLRAALSATSTVPLGYVLVELDAINNLCGRVKALVEAGSADAKSLAADAALLLEARRG